LKFSKIIQPIERAIQVTFKLKLLFSTVKKEECIVGLPKYSRIDMKLLNRHFKNIWKMKKIQI